MSDDTSRLFADREAPGPDGSLRKSHYGEGEQPWDVMLRTGIAAQFAAGSIQQLTRLTQFETDDFVDGWDIVQVYGPVRDALLVELTEEELKKINVR